MLSKLKVLEYELLKGDDCIYGTTLSLVTDAYGDVERWAIQQSGKPLCLIINNGNYLFESDLTNKELLTNDFSFDSAEQGYVFWEKNQYRIVN